VSGALAFCQNAFAMKRILLTVLFYYWLGILSAQPTYSKSIDLTGTASNGFVIKVLNDGYTILALSVDIPLLADYISVVHTDFYGEIVWQKHYKNEPWKITPPPVSNAGIAIDNDGNMYISGKIETNGNPFDVFLMKTNTEGDSVWMHTYGGALEDGNAKTLFHTDSTLLFLNGLTLSNNVNDFIIWLMETDLEGNVLWEKTFDGGYANTNPRDILLLDNGDFLISYLTCESTGICAPDDFKTLALTRFDKNGEEVWTNDVAFFEDNYIAPVMEALGNGGALVSFYRTNFEEGWHYPPILVWVDSLGKVTNQYDFLPDTERYVRDLHNTSSGTIIGAGYADMLELGLGGWVFAMSQEGELLWSRDINDLRFPEKWGRFNAVQEAENGGLIITGFIVDTVENNPMSSVANIWLVKLDSMGCLEPGCGDVQVISGSTEAQKPTELKPFKIYPNPVSGQTCLLERNRFFIATKLNIEITDSFGRTLWQTQITSENIIQLEISQFQRGIYFVKIEDSEGKIIQVEKLVIP
jgi:type IX secretion system substrate protein